MKKPEITWSLMHPTPLDAAYMKRVVKEAEAYPVDSFEICGACHSPLGGMDGIVLYEDFPKVAESLDRSSILANRDTLREILSIAHSTGRPVYYWHREAVIWPAVREAMEGLMDERDELDLLGDAYERLLRYKIEKTFQAVPELDGIVLTLTEADYSVLHNSRPETYPPGEVVSKIAGVFAEELSLRGKRFILRSFGSIEADYHQILDGARRAAHRFSFEVETKISPYDFDPFLPDNPFLEAIPGLTLGAECDGLGEFLGAGYLPAENVDNIVRYVRWGRKHQVDRYCIRLDRVGNNVFDSCPVNLYAYEEAILHPGLDAAAIRAGYAGTRYPDALKDELAALGEAGYRLATTVQYIDHQLIFHAFPPTDDLKWLKAGGIFSVFQEEGSLDLLQGIWSILSDRPLPSRAFILREKREARKLAEDCLAKVEAWKGLLASDESVRLTRLWGNAVIASTALEGFVRIVIAYLEEMEARSAEAPRLRKEIDRLETSLASFDSGPSSPRDTMAIPVESVYIRPMVGIAEHILGEYGLELRERSRWERRAGLLDLIVPGSVSDEGRCGRYMHGSHACIVDGRIGRTVGNRIFPNGFLHCKLHGSPVAPVALVLEGVGRCLVTVNGETHRCRLEDAPVLSVPPCRIADIVIRKEGDGYPTVLAIALLAEPYGDSGGSVASASGRT